MQILSADDPDATGAAGAALRRGQIVVVPTDTVYGVAALPARPEATTLIFTAKGRPAGQPLPVLASDVDQVRALGVTLPPAALALAERWWPGPLTMALGFTREATRPAWLEGRHEVAVRIPQQAFLLALLDQTGPLLVTSANRHGQPTPRSAADAAEALAPHVALAVDAGTLTDTPSTLITLRDGTVEVEREGAVSHRDIDDVLARAL
jgi:L-threonylcarbamoyladenylate synthase